MLHLRGRHMARRRGGDMTRRTRCHLARVRPHRAGPVEKVDERRTRAKSVASSCSIALIRPEKRERSRWSLARRQR